VNLENPILCRNVEIQGERMPAVPLDQISCNLTVSLLYRKTVSFPKVFEKDLAPRECIHMDEKT
jgi:hypothetical protein